MTYKYLCIYIYIYMNMYIPCALKKNPRPMEQRKRHGAVPALEASEDLLELLDDMGFLGN